MDFEKLTGIVKKIQKGRNIHQHLDLIAGLPYEDYPTFQKSFNDVYALAPDQLQLGFLKVLKGAYMHEMAESYECKYRQEPPYEVLSTKWLTYDEVIQLKHVDKMVDIYYNSGQFTYTLRHLEKEFTSSFQFYLELGKYYEDRKLHLVSHTRVARYEILLAFIIELQTGREEFYRELLTFDLYLRENVKNRPAFAGEATVTKEEAAQIYDKEAETHELLPDYVQ